MNGEKKEKWKTASLYLLRAVNFLAFAG